MSAFILAASTLTVLVLMFVLSPLITQASQSRRTPGSTKTAVVCATLVIELPAGLYAYLGTPEVFRSVATPGVAEAPLRSSEQGTGRPEIEAMVQRLAERLKQNPNDADGWRRLVRSYETLGQLSDAVNAYEHLVKLVPNDPDLLTQYAVTLGMSTTKSLTGKPEALLRQALAINPQHIQALALMGGAAFDRGDYADAVHPWQQVLALVPPGSDVARSIEANIDKAKALAGAQAAQ